MGRRASGGTAFRDVNARRTRVFPRALVTSFPHSPSPAAMRCLCMLVLALAGCQPGPPQTYRPPSPVVHTSSWGGFKSRFFGAPAYSVEEDLDAAQAASEGVRAVLLALPQKERGRLLSRWLPAAPTCFSGTVGPFFSTP